MKYRYISTIALRMMALFFFIMSINLLPNLIIQLVYYKDKADMLLSMAMVIPLLILSIMLWIFANGISEYIVKETTEVDEANDINYRNIAVLTFAAIGIYTIVQSLPQLISILVAYKVLVAQGMDGVSRMFGSYISRIIGEIIKILLGLWLLLGSQGITNAVKALRELGKGTIEVPKE